MTENSDSGFTEINQSKSSGSSPSAKSSSESPEPIVVAEKSSLVVPPKSSSENCPSDEDDSDDDDYEDSDTGKPDLLSWVSREVRSNPHVLFILTNNFRFFRNAR